MAKDYDPRRSSVTVGGEKKKRGILPIILGLLALLLLVLVIIGIASCGDDDGDNASAPAPSTSVPATPSAPPSASATPPATSSGAGGTLTASSQSLLSTDAASISGQTDQQATGTGVRVLSTSDDGFFVGTDASDRQYVEFGGDVGADETTGAYQAKVGDSVDLKGQVRPAPKSAGRTLKLNAADAKTVSDRGAYINADSVTPSAG